MPQWAGTQVPALCFRRLTLWYRYEIFILELRISTIMLPEDLKLQNPTIGDTDEEPIVKTVKPGQIRTRIAPSPTGLLHVGTARTALFNYIFAKHNLGSFILRIEDTDTERSKPEYEKNIIDSLKWLGLEWDEGPDIGGPYGPYRQSEKLPAYRKYLETLLAENKAYYCFCRAEELEAQRQYQMSIGQAPRYTGKCGNLSSDETEKRIKAGEKPVIRFRMPLKKVAFVDLVRGRTEFDAGLFGDVIIAKDLDTPLYNFAVVIDDYDMKISHVIRAEEHLSNTPRQILLQEALGLPKVNYAHLSLILAPDRSKLSKRHGATSVEEYRDDGYLPEALVNFIAFLGWNPGNEREIYNIPSLIKEFLLEKCQKSGAIFNVKKLDFLNGFYLRQKTADKVTELCVPYLAKSGLIEELDGEPGPEDPNVLVLRSKGKPFFKIKETDEIISFERLSKIISLYQERLKKLSEITELTDFFFRKNLAYEKPLLSWKGESGEGIKNGLRFAVETITEISEDDWNKDYLQDNILIAAEKFCKDNGKDRGYVLWPMRAALSGKQASAGPFEIAEILGKQKTLERLEAALAIIDK